jgi:AcrR family transcriptional regulator
MIALPPVTRRRISDVSRSPRERRNEVSAEMTVRRRSSRNNAIKNTNDRREEFLSIALKLFSEREFAAVTIKVIAAEANVNTALLYYYFKDKDDLFRAALEHAVAEAMQKYADVATKHSDPEDLIDDWFQMHFDLAPQIRRIVKILMDYSMSGSQTRILDDIIRKFYDEETRILSAAIKRGQKLGSFKAVNANKVAEFASTHLDGIMARSHIVSTLDLRSSINVLRDVFWAYVRTPAKD